MRIRKYFPVGLVIALLAVAGCGGGTAQTTGSGSAASSSSAVPSVSPVPSSSASVRSRATGHLAYGRFLSGDQRALFVAFPDGTGERQLLPSSDSEQPHFSPDGKRIAVTATGHVGAVINADGSGLRYLAATKPSPNLACVVWSPDATRLACEGFSDSAPADGGLYTVRSSDGGDLRRVTHARDAPCGFSPDGRRLLFLRLNPASEESNDLMVTNVDGSGKALLIRRGVGLSCDWAPNGKHFLAEAANRLMLLDSRGAVTPIPIKLAVAKRGSFSPDGTHIIFSGSEDGGEKDIYTARIDGSELVHVTNASEDEEFGDWGR
jgi:Tol biopolymer transport system component